MMTDTIDLNGAALKQVALAWYEYVVNVAGYTEAKWKAAESRCLAEYRTFTHKEWNGKQAKNIIVETQRWVLTDNGIDLYIEGRKNSLAG